MEYKIVKITDLTGKDKTDERARNRLGRIMELNKNDIKIGKKLMMSCVNPGWMKSVITSKVKDVVCADDGLIITTENSVYFLVKKDLAKVLR